MTRRPKDQFGLNLVWGELELILKIKGLRAFLRSILPFRDIE